MALSKVDVSLLLILSILLLARPAHAFGAGNIASISKVEGQNWRHGDLEDVLLGLITSKAMGGRKFSKLDVKRIYFGNWLRDYSQAVDVGTVKYVSAKAITILLWVLGFMSFGYGTKEFEVTMDRLGCYRPEEHIDNPKDYADNEDARQYDRRLRGPISASKELSIDRETGMKRYIASENAGITTSAGLVRKLFGKSIELGRRYGRNGRKEDLYEALRLLGTGCHCLEDFSAHSNYTELALIELGERDVFPHVGRNTRVQLRGARQPVYPLITGTFGGVDFLHSVTGEFDDKVTQSEIQELENSLNQAQQNQGSTSMLQDLLKKLPDGIFGDKNEAGKADELKQNAAAHQMQNTSISPREPEEWTQYLDDVQKQIYPIIEFHDEIMQSITETIEKIPILPDLLDSLQEQLNVFVFSLIAPFVLPIINQVKSELNTGSGAIIESSERAQHIVFHDDDSSDPTHSMLSKDHFSNVLNEPAGKVAGAVLKWVVPQLMAAWDDERVDVDRTLNRIIQGVMHHPALRQQGTDGSSDGRHLMFTVVEQWWGEKSENEKDGLRDQLSRSGVEEGRNHKPGVVDHGHGSCKPLGMPTMKTSTSSGAPGGLGGLLSGAGGQNQVTDQAGKMAAAAVGGGALGGLVGGLVSNIGGGILGSGLDNNQQTYSRTNYGDDGSRTQTVTQFGSAGDRFGQAQYSRTDYASGGHSEEYNRHEQSNTGGRWQSEVHHEERTSSGGFHQETRRYGDSEERESYGRHGSHQQQSQQSQQEFGGFGRRDEEPGYGEGRYGRQTQESSHVPGDYGRTQDSEFGGGRRYGRGHEEETSNRGDYEPERSAEYGGANRYEPQQPYRGREEREESYGRREDAFQPPGGFGRQQEQYGRGDADDEEPRYGRRSAGYENQSESRGYGGASEDEHESRGEYGGERGEEEETEQYGRRQRYGEEEYSGY